MTLKMYTEGSDELKRRCSGTGWNAFDWSQIRVRVYHCCRRIELWRLICLRRLNIDLSGGNVKQQPKVSLFHLLFLIGLTSTPVALAIIGFRELGALGAFLGVGLGVPLGALAGYSPYWIAGKILRANDSKS